MLGGLGLSVKPITSKSVSTNALSKKGNSTHSSAPETWKGQREAILLHRKLGSLLLNFAVSARAKALITLVLAWQRSLLRRSDVLFTVAQLKESYRVFKKFILEDKVDTFRQTPFWVKVDPKRGLPRFLSLVIEKWNSLSL